MSGLELRNTVAIVIFAISVGGCNEEAAAKLESTAGTKVCAMQEHLTKNAGLATDLIEGVVVASGTMTESDIAEGKATIAQIEQMASAPIEDAKNMVGGDVNCQTVVSKAVGIGREVSVLFR